MRSEAVPGDVSPANRYAAAVSAGESELARAVVLGAIEGGLPPTRALTDIVAAAMRQVGDLWEQGELNTADEHLATAVTERVLADMYRSLYTAPPLSRETVIAASVQGETHVLGTRMVADVLEGAGFRVVFLGGDLPNPDLLAAIDRHRPAAVLLGATSPWSDDALRAAVGQIRERAADLAVLVGGPAARRLHDEYDDLVFVPDATHVVSALERALSRT